MPREQPNPLLRHLRCLAPAAGAPEPGDQELLERFVSARDPDAFAALLNRYGQLVRTVARRVLRHEQDADDVFQATFLVFASRASSIRKACSVASWLYGVAFRTAMNSRRAKMRRNEEQRDADGQDREQPLPQAVLREVRTIVDEEVAIAS